MSSPVGGRPARAGIEIDHSSKSSSNNAAHHRPHRMRLLRLLLLRLRRSATDREGRRPARLRAKVRVVRPVVLSHLAPLWLTLCVRSVLAVILRRPPAVLHAFLLMVRWNRIVLILLFGDRLLVFSVAPVTVPCADFGRRFYDDVRRPARARRGQSGRRHGTRR